MKKILSVILVLFLLCGNVYSSETPQITVTYNREIATVSVTGTVSGNAVKASLMVLRPGASVTKMDENTQTFFEAAIHADETAVTEGAYTFDTFSVANCTPDTYTLRVACGKEVTEYPINIATEAQALTLMKDAVTAIDVLDNLTRFNEIYNLDIATDSVFDKIGTAGQQETALRIANANPATKTELKEEFDRNNLLYKIYLGPWTAVGPILQNNASLLGIDLSELNKVSDPATVYKALTGTLYTGTDFNTAYLAAVANNPKLPVNNGAIRPGGGGGGAYMPTATPETAQPSPAPTDSFSDVPNSHWAFNSVNLLSKRGIINGKGNNLFAPEEKVTRAEAVKMIVLTFSLKASDTAVSFSDINEADWSYSYICSAVSGGIVNGYTKNMFGKNDFVTRQDLAVMLYRAALKTNLISSGENTLVFSDAESIADYAKEAVTALANEEIINGYNGFFLPGATATRAETAKMLSAFLTE